MQVDQHAANLGTHLNDALEIMLSTCLLHPPSTGPCLSRGASRDYRKLDRQTRALKQLKRAADASTAQNIEQVREAIDPRLHRQNRKSKSTIHHRRGSHDLGLAHQHSGRDNSHDLRLAHQHSHKYETGNLPQSRPLRNLL